MHVQMLAGIRVLDWSVGLGGFCGRLLADLGADVVKIEPPGGEAGRQLPPLVDGAQGPSASALWQYLNQDKRSVTVDLANTEERSRLERLIAQADLLIETHGPLGIADAGLSYEGLLAANPRLVLTSITPFGVDGPLANSPATDLTSMARGGLVFLTGDPDRPPVRIGFDQAGWHAAAEAAAGSLIALFSREHDGLGQHVDVSVHATVATMIDTALAAWEGAGTISVRSGNDAMRFFGGMKRKSVFRCADGWVTFSVMSGTTGASFMQSLVQWMGEFDAAGPLADIDWQTFDFRGLNQEQLDTIEAHFEQFFLRFPRHELLDEAVRRRFLVHPLNNPDDVHELPPLVESSFFIPVEGPDLPRPIEMPGPYFRSSALAWTPGRPAPRPGEHNAQFLAAGEWQPAEIAGERISG